MSGRLRFALAVALTAALAPGALGAPICVTPEGTYPVIEPGRETEIRALFAPYVAGEPFPEAAEWTFRSIAVEQSVIKAKIEGPGGAEAFLVLEPRVCKPTQPGSSKSFALTQEGASSEAAKARLDALAKAVLEHDRSEGGFYRSWLQVVRQKPGEDPREVDESAQHGLDPVFVWSELNGTNLGLILILALGLLALLIDAPWLVRETLTFREGGGRVALILAGITLVGAVLRLVVEPSFIREAYALPNVAWVLDGVPISSALDEYPLGPNIMNAVVGNLLSDDAYEGWFRAHLFFGIATIPAAYLVGYGLQRRRAMGLVAAALLAFWPQHIRLSTSESVHVDFLFWGFIALAMVLLAARNGRFTSFVAACAATVAAAIMRPEAPLIMLGLVVLALAHGDGIRRALATLKGLLPRLLVVAVLVWLVYPTLMTILGSSSTQHFAPGSKTGEGVSLETFVRVFRLLTWPDGENGVFDPLTTPIWLYPLMWYGAITAWKQGLKGLVIGLAVLFFTYLILFSGMPPAVTVWKMGRYHATLLFAALPLATLGVWAATQKIPKLATVPKRLGAALGLAALGGLAWYPAVFTLDRDWQKGHAYAIELGRKFPEIGGRARVVLPDNRRLFLDMSPRNMLMPLTRGRQDMTSSIPVAFAVDELLVGDNQTNAYFFQGIFCYLAVGPEETLNPQCAAMHEVFELEKLHSRVVDAPPFLTEYEKTRAKPPYELALYKITGRKLSPEEGRKLIPPIIQRHDGRLYGPMGVGRSHFVEPPYPPLGQPLAPHLRDDRTDDVEPEPGE